MILLGVHHFGGEAPVRDVLRHIDRNWGHLIPDEQREPLKGRNELTWRNRVDSTRSRMVVAELLHDPATSGRGVWKLTSKGLAAAQRLSGNQPHLCLSFRRTAQAVAARLRQEQTQGWDFSETTITELMLADLQLHRQDALFIKKFTIPEE